MARQLALGLKHRGGKRRGAGRPRLDGGDKKGVPHLLRPDLARRHPVHVTLKARSGVGHLRRQVCVKAIERAFLAARERFGLRLAHYSVQGNHLHLIVEAEDRQALSRGMQGLTIRLARGLNRALRRSGKLFADRYHAHVLEGPREVAHALRYVLQNFRKHTWEQLADGFIDACSSARFLSGVPDDAPVLSPRTWLLRVGWRRADVSIPVKRLRSI